MSKIFHWSRAAARSPVTAKAIFVAGALAGATVPLSGMANGQTLPSYPVDSPLVAAVSVAPAIFFQYATLTGSGNTVNYSRLPVRTSTGAIKYYDVTTQFNVSSTGDLSIAAGFPKYVPSPPLITRGFKAGKYSFTDGNGNKYIAILDGPSVDSKGRTRWAFSRTADSYRCSYPVTADFYTGAIADNPSAVDLKAAGIVYPDYAYGRAGVYSCDSNFSSGAILGAAQAGNSLTIVSFTRGSTHNPAPVDQITYRLSP